MKIITVKEYLEDKKLSNDPLSLGASLINRFKQFLQMTSSKIIVVNESETSCHHVKLDTQLPELSMFPLKEIYTELLFRLNSNNSKQIIVKEFHVTPLIITETSEKVRGIIAVLKYIK